MNWLTIYIRRVLYLFLGTLDSLFSAGSPPVVILCYHSISNNAWEYSVAPSEFKKQISYLATKYNFVSLADLYLFLKKSVPLKLPAAVITFDDGYKNILQVKKFLTDLNIKPTVFIISDGMNVDRAKLETKQEFLSNEDLIELEKSGWEIGFHGATHTDLTSLSGSRLEKEVNSSKLPYFSYPWGKYNLTTVEVVKNAGFKLAVTMDDGNVGADSDLLRLPRVGVNGTHSLAEFQVLNSPSVVKFRKFVKSLI